MGSKNTLIFAFFVRLLYRKSAIKVIVYLKNLLRMSAFYTIRFSETGKRPGHLYDRSETSSSTTTTGQ